MYDDKGQPWQFTCSTCAGPNYGWLGFLTNKEEISIDGKQVIIADLLDPNDPSTFNVVK